MNSVIRLARETEIPRLVEMGQRFHRETEYRNHLAENPQRMTELAKQLVAGNGVLLSEREGRVVGMFGFLLFQHFISGEMIAGEVFWWVEPEHRGDGIWLLQEAEKRAKQAGAQRMQMIAPNAKVASIYQHFGYEFVESAYQKTL